MMDKREVQKKVLELKEKKGALILCHNYQLPEIQDVADIIGDSLELSKQAAQRPESLIVFCGVHFMAESAKILSPHKKVLLPRIEAGCFMSELISPEELKKLKAQHPDAKVVAYINTEADVKAESDVICTSSNAVKVVKGIDARKIIFVPDKNLALYVQRFTDKEIIPWNGFCYVHSRFKPEHIIEAKRAHPDALVLVHPECPPEVIDLADEVLSTNGMVNFVRSSPNKKFIIATEEGITYRMKKENPDKEFIVPGPPKICVNMKITRIEDVYDSLLYEKYEITVPDEILYKAKKALDEMLKYA
jgi:quinolinate synthase